MKQFFITFVSIILLSISASAQVKTIKHTVGKGETVTQIAQKYNVTPLDIYTLNPDARNGVKENTILLIPGKGEVKVPAKQTAKAEKPTPKSATTHVVVAKETPYGLAKQYGITLADLENANPDIKNGLQIGQTLTIPGSKTGQKVAPAILTKKEERKAEKEEKREEKKAEKEAKKEVKSESKADGNVVYEVVPKDTKYSISRRYGITVEELEKTNPAIKKDSLKIGQKLFIKANPEKVATVVKTETVQETPKQETPKGDYTSYQVKPKETLYSLSRQFGLSQNALVELNPELEKGVREGMVLKVPVVVEQAGVLPKNFKDLTKSISKKDRKELVLLLPFNVSKVASDTTGTVQSRLKKDGFLNMTLDFYSGALIAIDSAKTLGLNIDVKIFDSQENKTSTSVSSTFAQANLTKADVVVGPFYQTHAEKTAELLGKNNIPVISPLSKDASSLYTNLYQSMPTADYLKTAMFDYLEQKTANIVAVVDPKKGTTKKYISENHPKVRFAGFTETGGLNVESLKNLLSKTQMNYVIMETANTWMIKSTITALLAAKADYQIQLVILEPNEKLNSDEILISSLAKLNMLYASVTRENETPEAAIFAKVYKKKNNIFPNQYATRGFDVTFDALLRLSQEKSFEETIYDDATEGVENKFNYNKNPAGGYTNKGVYILYYDEDLSVKVAQ